MLMTATKTQEGSVAGELAGAEVATGASLEETMASMPERPDPEVPAKAKRWHFAGEYKRRILREADKAAGNLGEIGALLRREGLYSSHLITWRAQRERGEVAGLSPKKRGRKPKEINPLAKRVAELERDKRRLERKVAQQQVMLDIQKKVSELLGIPLNRPEDDESE